MLKLYEIPDAYRALEAAIDDGGGEFTDEIAAGFDALATDLVAHADNVGGLLKEWEAEEDAYRKESTRMGDRARALSARRTRLKEKLLASLEAAKVEKVKGRRFSVRVGKSSKPTIRWESEDAPIPRAFSKLAAPTVDADAAYAAHKAGTLPDGFTVKFTQFVEIR